MRRATGSISDFAADPTVIVKVYVMEKFKTIYVQKEAFGYGVPNNRLGELIAVGYRWR